MPSPMQGRRRMDASDRINTAEMFDNTEVVMSDGKRGDGNTPSVVTPQMMMPQMR